MKKLIKSTVAVASAVAMAFTMAAVPTVSALADDTAEPAPVVEVFDTATFGADEVHYTLAGGCAPGEWTPLAKANELKETEYEGVYALDITVPAYSKDTEYQNRFKICRIDSTVMDAGWGQTICLGTDKYGDSQTQFRIENEEEGNYTVYFQPTTGAVVIKDAEGKLVDYTISWVGNEKDSPIIKENDNDFVSLEVAAKSDITKDWELDKVLSSVTEIPDFAAINAKLVKAIDPNFDTADFAADEVHYTIAGGCAPGGWTPLAKSNDMKKTEYDGVYAINITVPAYSKDTEWQNRFKICRIDSMVMDAGWGQTICLGTDKYGDSQTQFRIENEKEGNYTVYFQPTTGAVVIKDAEGKLVDYTISWVGNEKDSPIIKENDNDFVSLEVAAKSDITKDWELDKILSGVTKIPDFTTINAKLADVLSKPVAEASLKIKAGKTTLYTGKSTYKTTIKATVKGDSKKVTYKSSNTKVATVSSKGVVTAKKAGKVVISAKANGITKKVTITVKNPTITVKNGSKKVSSVSLKKAKSVKLSVTTSPSKAGFKATYATSASKKIVKITTSGSKVTVKGLKKGTAKVKITSGGATKTVKVTVK